jgi:CubicO group peptidase (beta-lactamase class C family)
MSPTISTEGLQKLKLLLQNAVQSDLPLGSASIVNADQELFHHEALSSAVPVQAGEKVFWLASCTKLVTAIACMQLVEQGKLALDDGDQLETLCPYLRSVQVVELDGSRVDKCQKITLRMLLTHTGTSPI